MAAPVRFFALLAIVALAASWKAPPIDPFLRLLPLFKIAFNDRLGFAAALSLSLLAAMAFDWLVLADATRTELDVARRQSRRVRDLLRL